MYICFMFYALVIIYFLYSFKTCICYQIYFGFNGTSLLLRGFSWACGRPCSLANLWHQFLCQKKMVRSAKIEIKKFNG